jgi:hypothetical protein
MAVRKLPKGIRIDKDQTSGTHLERDWSNPSGPGYILTEDREYLTTEGGERLIIEEVS